MLLPDCTYHLCNHANGHENLFKEEKNYIFFLERVSRHVLPVCNVYAYCLMPNHYHLLVRVKPEKELRDYFFTNKSVEEPQASISHRALPYIDSQEVIAQKISKSFSNLFNSYTQAFNKMYERMGSLFMQNMKREEVKDDNSFCKVVHYIHTNPVHHQFVKGIGDWQYSSYKTFLSKSPTKLDRDFVLNMFGGLDWFIKYHQQPIDPKTKFLE